MTRFDSFDSTRAFPVDIFDLGGAYEITASLPGVDVKQTQVFVTTDTLTIRVAETEKPKTSRVDHFLRQEHVTGQMTRVFMLPETIIPDKVMLSLRRGFCE